MAKRRKNNIKKHSEINPDLAGDDFMGEGESSETNTQSDSSNNESSEETQAMQTQPDETSPEGTHKEKIMQEQNTQSEESQNSGPIDSSTNTETGQENIEHASKVSESSIGTFLRSARDKKQISLQDIASSTKISITNLELLEQDNFDLLPDRAYVTGYVKNYARVVGVSIDECMEELEKTYLRHGEPQVDPDIVIPQATNSPNVKAPLPIAKIATALGIFVAIIVLVVVFVMFFNSDDDSDEIVQPKEVQQEIDEAKEITPQSLNSQTPLQDELEPSPAPNDNSDESTDVESNKTTAENKARL